MRWTTWVRSALLLGAAVLFARSARGGEVRDGVEFAVTIPDDARACILFPKTLFDRTICPVKAKPLAAAPLEGATALVIGSMGLDDGSRAVLSVTRMDGGEVSRPNDIDAFARGMADRMVSSRPGTKLRGLPQATLVDCGGITLVRASFDIDRYLEDGAAHEIAYVTWTLSGWYLISVTGLASDAAPLDAVASRMATTVHVAHPAPSAPARSPSYRLGVLTGTALVPVISIVVTVVLIRRDRRKRVLAR